MFAPIDDLLLEARHLACVIRAQAGEAARTRQACAPQDFLRSLCLLLPAEQMCALAHLRYFERLRVAAQLPRIDQPMQFRDAA